jgi:2-oxoglutarate ferredoxin oxidoreductase subunit beta
MQTKSLPEPNINTSINPIMLALAAGFTFIARSYAYNTRHLKEMIKKAVAHKGFAFIDALQPCPTYNDINTKEWYGGEDRIDPVTKKAMSRTYELESTGYNGRVTADMSEDEIDKNLVQVIEKSREWGDKIPIGVFYQNETVPIYEERIRERSPSYLSEPPASQHLAKNDGNSVVNLASLSKELLYESLVVAQ